MWATITIYFSLVVLTEVSSLKCYQCSSLRDRGCFAYNLNRTYLRECPDKRAVCRSLSQVQYFTGSNDVTVIRECAYVYTEPLGCVQSKFSDLHYSQSCECNEDECNRARSVQSVILLLLSSIVFSW